jgi:fatty acid desaturase
MLSLIINVIFTTMPLALILLFYPSHILGIFNVLFNSILWLGRYALLMHFTVHRDLFNSHYRNFGKLLLNIICPFIGFPPGFYRLQHIAMHHNENNIFDKDLSSTEPYQRDSFCHYLVYFLKYWTYLILLPLYAIKKERYDLAFNCIMGSIIWLSIIITGLFYN